MNLAADFNTYLSDPMGWIAGKIKAGAADKHVRFWLGHRTPEEKREIWDELDTPERERVRKLMRDDA